MLTGAAGMLVRGGGGSGAPNAGCATGLAPMLSASSAGSSRTGGGGTGVGAGAGAGAAATLGLNGGVRTRTCGLAAVPVDGAWGEAAGVWV